MFKHLFLRNFELQEQGPFGKSSNLLKLLLIMKTALTFQNLISTVPQSTVKPVQNGHSLKDQTMVFKAYYRLMQVKSIAECSKGSILQYF